ncbi:hypothetical protein C8R44DRAFT_866053 [Mycena epipterygia]|nr:hypothetical protein C8R44DRAFT_866053 [Mycena epipterygia]
MSTYAYTPVGWSTGTPITDTEIAWSVAAAEVFRYGVYLVIFGFYLHVLRTHGIAQHRFLTASTISLFVLGTAHCALQLATTVFHVRILIDVINDEKGSSLTDNLEVYCYLAYSTSAVYVTSNVIADSIFIFRCYAIWGSRRKIIIFPTILTMAMAGLGYCNLIVDRISSHYIFNPSGPKALGLSFLFIVSVAASLFTTVVLMGLTVGRIWWLARAARQYMARKVADRYRTVCAIILESGALYCIGVIAFLAVGFGNPVLSLDIQSDDAAAITSGAILGQLVGIAPTIIAARVGLGYSVENVDSFIAAAPRTRPSPQNIPASPSVESRDDQFLHIRADDDKAEVV